MTGDDLTRTLRIGVLGAAKITRGALLKPAAKLPDVSVDAIGARDRRRAAKYAARHGIDRVLDDYDALINDASINAVYVPLPAALHGRWAIAALDAGKHVLVEKPFTANAEEAQRVVDAATRSGLVVMEAFHSVYHPIVATLRKLIADDELGRLTSASAHFSVPIPPGGDIRWNESLGGGALMDLGCYPIRMLQSVLGYDATVVSATAASAGAIDRSMKVHLAFPRLPEAVASASMWSKAGLGSGLRLTGDKGEARVSWPFHPQMGSRLRVRTASGTRRIRVDRSSTYDFQLAAFRDAVIHGTPLASGPTESVAMMQVIDDAYRMAGMWPRRPLAPQGDRS